MEGPILRTLGVKPGEGIQRYLGLPYFSLRKKRLQFEFLKDRMEKKIQVWNQREFSAGGKEVLIKSVVQAVPTFAMQCFRIPDSICEDMNRICAAFWWGEKEGERRMHWARLERMCEPKEKGGMGFRNLKIFNKALVAQQAWRMMTKPNLLVSRVFRAKYFKNGDLMTAVVPSTSSYVWRSIAWGHSLLREGMVWSVGNGRNIKAMKDGWVKGAQSEVHGRADGDSAITVEELIDEHGGWNLTKN
ncbi:uncharacterized mitochondrial protein AtMg00310-like [Salvia miltiorrhiza]|uniref:uncharacterized mitochondrial protein AtMg00310-like n=1 Tax=Salvia miltiorrhiza TaxID=226208 RepID=UPI0025ABC569|nr:uncharacterized mitochondrial protein AtMg00310-like [Salvia miltiorrhiza]